MKIAILLLSHIALSVHTYSQSRVLFNDPITYGAYAILHGDGFSASKNIVASLIPSSFSFGCMASIPYGISEIKNVEVYAILPTHNNAFRLNGSLLGTAALQDARVAFSYAMKLNKLGVGAQFNYYGIRMQESGNAQALGASLALSYKLSSKLGIGIQIDNPVATKYSKNLGERISSRYSIGIGYVPGDQFSLELYNQYDAIRNLFGSVAFQYNPIRIVPIRCGVSYTSGQFWACVGIQRSRLRLMFSAVFNQRLGVTPGVSFQSFSLVQPPNL